MKNYDVQSVLIQTSAKKAFEFIASPQNLVKWTSAFNSHPRGARADSGSKLNLF